jgi:hypothetical protein
MTQEGKTVTLASTTVFMYGLVSYLQFNQVIFPFPLNEIIFLITSVLFARIHFKNSPKTISLIIALGLLNVLSYEFYWNIFLSNDNMLSFSKSSATDIFKLFYYIGLIAWIISTFNEIEINFRKYFSLLPITLLLTGSIFSKELTPFYSQIIIFLSTIFVFVFVFSKLKQFPIHYLWMLLFILELTKVWSLASLR